MITVSKTSILVEDRKFSKIQNCRNCWKKIWVNLKENWQDHWEWHSRLFQTVSKQWARFRKKELESHMSWKQETFNGDYVFVNGFFKGNIGRSFCMTLWPGTKNSSIKIIPKAESHGDIPAILPSRWPNQVFTAPRSCSALDGTSSLSCTMSCLNKLKHWQVSTIERKRCIWAEH